MYSKYHRQNKKSIFTSKQYAPLYFDINHIKISRTYLPSKLIFFWGGGGGGEGVGKDLHCKGLKLNWQQTYDCYICSYTVTFLYSTYYLHYHSQNENRLNFHLITRNFILIILVFLSHTKYCYHIGLPKIIISTINDKNQEYATSSSPSLLPSFLPSFLPSVTQHKLNTIVP